MESGIEWGAVSILVALGVSQELAEEICDFGIDDD